MIGSVFANDVSSVTVPVLSPIVVESVGCGSMVTGSVLTGIVVVVGEGSMVTGSVLTGMVDESVGSSVSTGSVLIGIVVVVGEGSKVTGSVLTGCVVGIGVVIGGGRAVISYCGGGSIHCHDQTQTYENLVFLSTFFK